MPIFVNQAGTRAEVVGVWVNDNGTVREVRSGWVNQNDPTAPDPNMAMNVNLIYSTSVDIDLPASTGQTINRRTGTTAFDYGASLHRLLPAGTLASEAETVNLNANGVRLLGAPNANLNANCTRRTTRINGLNDQGFFGGSGNNGFAETSVPGLYIAGNNRSRPNGLTVPNIPANQLFADGSVITINLNGGEISGGAGRGGRGRCNNHGCHSNTNNNGGAGGPAILVDGINNVTINLNITGGATVRGGGGGGGGSTTGAHSHCCPKHGGAGVGGIWSGGYRVNTNIIGCEPSHGAPEGGRGGQWGRQAGGNSGYRGGFGGSIIEFRNCANPTFTITGNVGNQFQNQVISTTSARMDNRTVLL